MDHLKIKMWTWEPGMNLELYFAGWEWLVLHHYCAAAGQDHDVQLLLLLMGLLIPLTGHFSVMSRY